MAVTLLRLVTVTACDAAAVDEAPKASYTTTYTCTEGFPAGSSVYRKHIRSVRATAFKQLSIRSDVDVLTVSVLAWVGLPLRGTFAPCELTGDVRFR